MKRRNLMRSLIIVAFLFSLLTAAGPAYGQTSGYVELWSQADLKTPKNVFVLDAGISRPLSDKFGISMFSLLTNGWGELYLGPTFKPAPWTELNLSFGGEQGADGKISPRYACSAAAFGRNLFFLGILEVNDDALSGKTDAGLWYLGQATWSPIAPLAIGLETRRPDGLGPRISWKIRSVKLWATWMPLLPESGKWRMDHIISGLALDL
jgi:hypothetical protein